jgi:hypothetical protein
MIVRSVAILRILPPAATSIREYSNGVVRKEFKVG